MKKEKNTPLGHLDVPLRDTSRRKRPAATPMTSTKAASSRQNAPAFRVNVPLLSKSSESNKSFKTI